MALMPRVRIRHTWALLLLTASVASSVLLGCQALLNTFRNTIVVHNSSSSAFDGVLVDLPEGHIDLGRLRPGQNRRTTFWAPPRDGELTFVVTRGPERFVGIVGRYLDGTAGEQYEITISDGLEYHVTTVYHYLPDGKHRMEPAESGSMPPNTSLQLASASAIMTAAAETVAFSPHTCDLLFR